ncbi:MULTISPECIES: WXG100 family type VII secretion target [Amycolatopsis]|uniref:ESX-1 secretion-associated protein n=1 Tax=Amycolatopsis thermalba TaxID=944492 RepID=A0ABY4NNZ9_9PSEU|nr:MULTISPECIES: type VII secretion target [Amycolatopsis]OXM73985.1 hypothetical protein CF166_07205 [Amycolatopsis sp. KNN50.9b]UQS22359.1 hypothetical protein L1857_05760 [Amycolatopsis thermalba]
MAGGFQVDVEALRTTAARASDLTGKVSELQQATYEADVPVVSWGLLGAGTAFPVYREMLGKLKDHLNEMSAGYQSIGVKLTSAADAYSSMDDEVVRAFGDVAELLDETDAGTEAI